MRDSKSSAVSHLSKGDATLGLAGLAGIVALLAAISGVGLWWCWRHGYSLYYGDAEAHLNIARRVIDSRTPGPEQLGTVWLPLPHILMIPFVGSTGLWRNGLAGAIPSAVCFVAAGAFFFAAARRAYGCDRAALAVALLFALNPNMLYLQATPMTEPVFAATLAALLWATLWFRDSQSALAAGAAAVASNAACLTRYEGWFLVPFLAVYFLAAARKKWHALLFGAVAVLGPVAWLAHNRYYYGNALEFYNGPYSALAIQGAVDYPGHHDWRKAIQYYFAAVRLTSGWPLLALGTLGGLAALVKRAWWPLFLLALAPAFYVWSVHSGASPIHVPDLPPYSWYNTRYALAVLPLAAMAAGALVMLIPFRFRLIAALAMASGVSAAWALAGDPVCWKESEVNSEARRAWTREASVFLAQNYREGSGIIFSFGDLTGVLREAGIPLREGLHEGNGPAWDAAVIRPDLSLHQEWALVFQGDVVAKAVSRAGQYGGPHFQLRKQIIVKGAPVVEIYQRWRLPGE